MNDHMKPKAYDLENYIQSPETIRYLEKMKDPEYRRTMHLTQTEKEIAMPIYPPTTLGRITRIAVEHLGVDVAKVTPEARISEDLGADSLDHVELIMAIEEEFGIEIADEQAEKITTISEAVALVDATAA